MRARITMAAMAALLSLPLCARGQDDIFPRLKEIAGSIERGEIEQAVSSAEDLATEFPQLFDVRMYAGWASLLAGRYDQALEHYEAANAMSRGNAEALSGIAWCHIGKGEEDLARASAKAALELDPDNEHAAEAMARLDRRKVHGGLLAHGLWTSNVPGLDWGVGAVGALMVDLDTVDWRLGYRISHVSGLPEEDTSTASNARRDWSSGQSDSTQAHFASLGADLTIGELSLGGLVGIAGTSNQSWLAGVFALRTSFTYVAEFSMAAALVASSGENIWQMVPRIDIPFGPVVRVAVLAHVTENTGRWMGYGELRLGFETKAAFFSVGGGYGLSECPLEYDEATLRDYRETLTWRGLALLRVRVSGAAWLHLSYEIAGTEIEDDEGSVFSGLLQSAVIGVLF